MKERCKKVAEQKTRKTTTEMGGLCKERHACHAAWFRLPDQACFIIRCKNLAVNIRYCLSLCLSKDTLEAVGPFYLVSMPEEVKHPTRGVNRQIPCRGLHTSLNHSCVSPNMGCFQYIYIRTEKGRGVRKVERKGQ